MRGVLLDPKDENIATEFTEITKRLFSFQMQHTQGLPFTFLLSVLSVAQNRVHRDHRETIFLSDAAYAGTSFHSFLLSVLSVAQNRVHRGHRETIFLSDAAYAKMAHWELPLHPPDMGAFFRKPAVFTARHGMCHGNSQRTAKIPFHSLTLCALCGSNIDPIGHPTLYIIKG
jgi:hypothetical protein